LISGRILFHPDIWRYEVDTKSRYRDSFGGKLAPETVRRCCWRRVSGRMRILKQRRKGVVVLCRAGDTGRDRVAPGSTAASRGFAVARSNGIHSLFAGSSGAQMAGPNKAHCLTTGSSQSFLGAAGPRLLAECRHAVGVA